MKGRLHKTILGWVITRQMNDEGIRFGIDYPLHPKDHDSEAVRWAENGSLGDKEVEFVVHEVWEQANGETQVSRYAKLADAVRKDVVMSGPQYIPEISDEEIEKAAKQCRFQDLDVSVGSFELGARWYREQLKNR